MKISLRSALTALSMASLAACAHGQPPRSSTTSLTSAEMTRPAPNAFDDTYAPTMLPPMAQWAWRYPDAASELGQWVMSNREVARSLGRWQLTHPEKFEALVDWAAGHESEPLGAFLLDRAGWRDLQALAGGTDDLRGFLAWTRRAPSAARELSLHTDGLTFADEHAGALAQMSHSEASMRANPLLRDMALRSAGIPSEPSPLASPPGPRDDATRGGGGLGPPLGSPRR